MSISVSDIKFRKPVIVSDTNSNGGPAGDALVLSGVRHNLFPRVTKAERTSGVTRYRKQFWSNENAANFSANDVLVWLEHPSNAGDRFYLSPGTQSDTQQTMLAANPAKFGAGKLNANVIAGGTSVTILMEQNDFDFPNGSLLHVSDKFLTSQTVDATASIGDSVEITGGTWFRISNTTNIEYPVGVYIGQNTVMTVHATANEAWLQIAINQTVQTIASGLTGATQTPALTSLTGITVGVSPYEGYRPVITTSAGVTPLTVTVGQDGVCSGDCTGGQLNMTTGTWTTSITWTVAPDADIVSVHHDKSFTYAGNVATVSLEDTLLTDYAALNTYTSPCIKKDTVSAIFTHGTVSSVAGSVNHAVSPIQVSNIGTVYDTFTLTMTTANNFSVVGSRVGSLATGNNQFAYSPSNPAGGYYFTIPIGFWEGSWQAGDTYTFSTSPAKLPIWVKEVVPSGTTQEPSNLITLGWYSE